MTDQTPVNSCLADQASAHLLQWRAMFGPLIACPVVHLKAHFHLSLASAEALARQLHDAGVWCLGRMPSGLACAEIQAPSTTGL